MLDNTVKIYVPLLDEGTPTLRPTQAIPLGNNLYKLLPTSDYNPKDEIWEFLPGSTVRCDEMKSSTLGKTVLRACEVQNMDGSFTRSSENPRK